MNISGRDRYRALLLLTALVVVMASLLARTASPVQGAGTIQTLVVAGGQPDDVTIDGQGRLVWGDLTSGTLRRLDRSRIVTIARNLSVPEGVVVLPNGTTIVAEQGRDRIVRLSASGTPDAIHYLQPVAGQEGVDGIGRDPRNGDLLVPDSPNGTVLRMGPMGRNVRVIARGLGRPVDAAVDASGNVLVPDEHLGTLVVISPRGRISYRGSFNTPDDVAVARNGRIWVTSLGDGGLWELNAGGAPQRVLAGLGNPQGLTLDRCGDPIVVEQNTARIVRLLLKPSAVHCAL